MLNEGEVVVQVQPHGDRGGTANEQEAIALRRVLSKAPPGYDGHWPPFSVNLFVGPEGGFTADEVGIARRYNLVPVSLGPRILRSETAPLAAIAALQTLWGDLR